MNSRCLFCDKRLSFFHIGKPFCSDVHEDRYLEQQSRTGLNRLLDDSLATPPKPPELLTPVQALPPTTLVFEQYSYPKPDASDPESSEPIEEDSSEPLLPMGTFEISAPDVVKAARPLFPWKDPADATFPAEPGAGEAPLHVARTLLSFETTGIALGSMSFVDLPVESTVVAASQARLECPARITIPAPFEIAPLSLADPIGARVFVEPSLSIAFSMALPGAVQHRRRFALTPVPAQNPDVSEESVTPQPAASNRLPAQPPLRFRSILNLNTAIFDLSSHRIMPRPQISFDWSALPPPAVSWPSRPIRRQIAAVIPKLRPQANRPIHTAMRELEK